MLNKHPSAFSLIELSFAVLIIAILIAGITSGSRLFSAFKLSNAKTITASSSVNSIDGLLLWLDSTAEDNLANTSGLRPENNDNVKTWIDQNIQHLEKTTFTANGSEYPIYKTDGINGLPTLYFNGSNPSSFSGSSMTAPFSDKLNPAAFTFFIVLRPISIQSGSSAVFSSFAISPVEDAGRGFALYRDQGYDSWIFNEGDGYSLAETLVSSQTISYSKNQILSIVGNSTDIALYKDGISQGSANNITYVPNIQNTVFYLGSQVNGSFYYNGYISEFILYGKKLKNEERRAVESYLSKKYAIPVN